MEKFKLLPSGIADFVRIRTEGYYYVDKTMYIEKMEQVSSFLFLVRPRRFGKSLYLSMVQQYYDCKAEDSFDELFGGLWVHDHPTDWHHKYQVLKLDFSRVPGNIDQLPAEFNIYCGMEVNIFAERYQYQYYPGFADEVKELPSAISKLNYIGSKAREYGNRLYLIVDEYDNFTNTVLSQHGHDVYRALTHGTGFYRDVFKIFKAVFDRVLMLGVSPVTLDDLTSGYNIATNITTDPRFNHVLGFSETEVREMFCYYQQQGLIQGDIEAMIEEMRPWYDNYCFARASLDEDRSFNSNMVVRYLNTRVGLGHAPETMLDPNTATDYKKMKQIIRLDQLSGDRRGTLIRIAEEGFVYGQLTDHFPAEQMMEEKNFVSLLFYYGMLTIGGMHRGRLKLTIPNNNVRAQYYQYLLEEYNRVQAIDTTRLDDSFALAAYEGEWEPMMRYIGEQYSRTASARSLIEGERNIQGFMLAMLSLCPYYLVAPEVGVSHGYCDFFLMPDFSRLADIAHSYIVEMKYVKQDESEAAAEAQWHDAVAQIRGYAEGEVVRKLQGASQLHLLVAQWRGYELARIEEIKKDE